MQETASQRIFASLNVTRTPKKSFDHRHPLKPPSEHLRNKNKPIATTAFRKTKMSLTTGQ